MKQQHTRPIKVLTLGYLEPDVWKEWRLGGVDVYLLPPASQGREDVGATHSVHQVFSVGRTIVETLIQGLLGLVIAVINQCDLDCTFPPL